MKWEDARKKIFLEANELYRLLQAVGLKYVSTGQCPVSKKEFHKAP